MPAVAERRRAKVADNADRRRVTLGNAERMNGAHLAYETFHGLPMGSSTVAQIERSSAGVAGWAEYASVMESYNGQKLMGLQRHCQPFGVAEKIRKADATCQKLLKHTGLRTSLRSVATLDRP